MTRLKASCGCGWVSKRLTQSQQVNTISQAIDHANTTGHICEISGKIFPDTSSGVISEKPTRKSVVFKGHDVLRPPTPHGAGAGAHSGNGGPRHITPSGRR